jgi:hypothetical protein
MLDGKALGFPISRYTREYPMRRSLFFHKYQTRLLSGLVVFAFLFRSYAASIDHAKITQVVNDVNVLNPESKHVSPAKTDAEFATPNLMKTGDDSRSEMMADDQTITRVGADTLFSFEPKERVINLKQGSVLFESPPGKGGGSIRTAAATASVMGTTIIVVYSKTAGFKLMVLEGTATATMPNGRKVIVHAGQLVVIAVGAKEPGPVLTFLLSNEVQTSLLVRGFKRQLPSWDKILKEILKQEKEIAAGLLQAPTNVVGNPVNPNTRINQIQGLGLHNNPTPPPVIIAPTIAPTPMPTPRQTKPGGGSPPPTGRNFNP